MPYFITFKEILKEQLDPNLVGGKASSLARLYQAGFLVPEGFIITTEFFDSLSKENVTIFFKKSAKIIYEHIDECSSHGLIAVRSSASVEDSINKSFAGQFDSFLNVEKDQVLEAVKTCWQSLNSARANRYAQGQNPDQKMAVIVQDMIIPKVSGVAFSAHPVTGDRDSIVIEAVLGGNELLVQGVITPDYYLVSKNFQILDKKIVPQNGAHQQKLSNFQILKIAQSVFDASCLFGTEVDVEWAIESGKLYFLQSRPITAIQ